jgi:Tfp pilus assembly protein PilX
LKNRGIALLAGLVLLAAVSLLALSAASGAVLQSNMAINYQENAIALQNASIAESYAMAWLNSRAVSERQSGCQTNCLLPIGIHNPGELPAHPEFESVEWWRANAFVTGYNAQTAETLISPDQGAEPARWIIEEIHYLATGDTWDKNRAEGLGYYRILSRATGRNPGSVAVSELIAARPWEGVFQAGPFPPDGSARAFCKQFETQYDCGRVAWRQRR